MQEQAPKQTKKPMTKRPVKRKSKKPVGKTTKTIMSNPYQRTPVKTNNMMAMKSQNQVPTSGFGFPGAGGSLY